MLITLIDRILSARDLLIKSVETFMGMVYNTADSDIQMQSGFGKGYINV